MSTSPHDPAQPVGTPGIAAPAVPGTGTAPAAPNVWETTPTAPTPYAAPQPPAYAMPATAAAPYAPPAPAPAGPYGAPSRYAPGPAPGASYVAPSPYAPAPQTPYGAPPAYGVPSPYADTSPHVPAPSAYQPAPPYPQPAYPELPPAPYHYGQPAPAGYQTPPLADQVPGAVAHDGYTDERFNRHQPPVGPDGQPLGASSTKRKEPTAWNRWALIMLVLFITALGALVYPQYRARSTEHELKPLVVGLAGPHMWARCPRYITSVFTYVGAVTMDGKGNLSDHTELTGPICSGLRHLYTPSGRAEMSCLVTSGNCPQSALNSVVALATITHESMHLRGILDEGQAECSSVSEAQRAAVLAGLTAQEGAMIGYLHLTAMNPDTPPQYRLTPTNCPSAVAVARDAPGTPLSRLTLMQATRRTWMHIAGG